MGELSDFQRQLLELGLPLGTVFTLELVHGVRDWSDLQRLDVIDLGRVPGMTPDRVTAVRAAAEGPAGGPGTLDARPD